jgi:hypothetical protein
MRLGKITFIGKGKTNEFLSGLTLSSKTLIATGMMELASRSNSGTSGQAGGVGE